MSSDRPVVVSPKIKNFLACLIVLIATYLFQSITSSIFTIGFNVFN